MLYKKSKENIIFSNKLEKIYNRHSLHKYNEDQRIKDEKIMKKRNYMLRTLEEIKIERDNYKMGIRLQERYIVID